MTAHHYSPSAERRLTTFTDQLHWSALRLMQDILLDGDHHYWQRRAQQFEDARRKSGEYIGSEETPESMAARDRALTETAQACRNKAEAVRMYGDPELTGVLSMVLTDQLLTEGRRAA